jgi:hypothetical protein
VKHGFERADKEKRLGACRQVRAHYVLSVPWSGLLLAYTLQMAKSWIPYFHRQGVDQFLYGGTGPRPPFALSIELASHGADRARKLMSSDKVHMG